eukprot:12278_1
MNTAKKMITKPTKNGQQIEMIQEQIDQNCKQYIYHTLLKQQHVIEQQQTTIEELEDSLHSITKISDSKNQKLYHLQDEVLCLSTKHNNVANKFKQSTEKNQILSVKIKESELQNKSMQQELEQIKQKKSANKNYFSIISKVLILGILSQGISYFETYLHTHSITEFEEYYQMKESNKQLLREINILHHRIANIINDEQNYDSEIEIMKSQIVYLKDVLNDTVWVIKLERNTMEMKMDEINKLELELTSRNKREIFYQQRLDDYSYETVNLKTELVDARSWLATFFIISSCAIWMFIVFMIFL